MPSTRVAIAGLGAIGRALARHLAAGVPGLALACAAARDRAKAGNGNAGSCHEITLPMTSA